MRRNLGILFAASVVLFAGYGLYRSLPVPNLLDVPIEDSLVLPPSASPHPAKRVPKRRLRMRNTLQPLWPVRDLADAARADSLEPRLPPRMVPVLLRPGDTALDLADQLYADVPDAGSDLRQIGGRRLLMAMTFELNGVDDPNRIKAGARILFYNTSAMSLTVDAREGTLAEAVHRGRLALDSAVVLVEGRGAGQGVAREVGRLMEKDPRYRGIALRLVVRNRTGSPQTAYIPRGRGFEVQDVTSNAQQLLIVEARSLRLEPYATGRTVVPVVCLNQPKKAPEAGTQVALTVLRATGSLEKALDEPPVRTQLAVWDVVGWLRQQGLARLERTTGGY